MCTGVSVPKVYVSLDLVIFTVPSFSVFNSLPQFWFSGCNLRTIILDLPSEYLTHPYSMFMTFLLLRRVLRLTNGEPQSRLHCALRWLEIWGTRYRSFLPRYFIGEPFSHFFVLFLSLHHYHYYCYYSPSLPPIFLCPFPHAHLPVFYLRCAKLCTLTHSMSIRKKPTVKGRLTKPLRLQPFRTAPLLLKLLKLQLLAAAPRSFGWLEG